MRLADGTEVEVLGTEEEFNEDSWTQTVYVGHYSEIDWPGFEPDHGFLP